MSPDDAAPARDEEQEAAAAAALALARARKAAADKGLRPGLKPLRRRRPANQPQGTPSGSGPDARDPMLIGEQLEKFVADRGWEVDVAVGSVIGRWSQLVGPDIAEHVQPVSFENGILTLRADLGEDPVLVLDDVFAELDSGRRDRLAHLVEPVEQVLVTAAVEADVPAGLRERGTTYAVTLGEVSRVA